MVEEVAAPSGRCLRSGHKNSVKGKGAIKHKGAPTIIYHCTDAPFRLAPLATHPPKWGWARKAWRRGAINANPCLPLLAGGGGPRSGGRGAAPSGHKNSVKGKGAIKHKGAPTIIYHCTDAPFRLAPLATHPLSGGGQEKHGCPLPSRSARHPPPKWGWARNMEARSDNSKPFLPVIVRWEWEGRPKAADGRVTGAGLY